MGHICGELLISLVVLKILEMILLEDYFQNIKIGAVFAYSDYDDDCPKHTVIESVILKNKSSILVMCEMSRLQVVNYWN